MKNYIYPALFLIVIILLNCCTPIATGGPVSANVIYKTYNKSTMPSFCTCVDSFSVDINNDGAMDLTLLSDQGGGPYPFTEINPLANVELANYRPTDSVQHSYYQLKSFGLQESINSSNYWLSNTRYLLSYPLPLPPIALNVQTLSDNSYILGVRIKTGSDYHFAWIRLTTDMTQATIDVHKIKTTLIESAYNKNVNEYILAGKK